MKRINRLMSFAIATCVAIGISTGGAMAQKRGGILKYVIPSNPPSADAHRETTFGTVHPFAQFYSVLIRVNPDNPGSPTDFKCDLCVGEVPKPTNGGLKYTFKIRKNVKWHQPPSSKMVPAKVKEMAKKNPKLLKK